MKHVLPVEALGRVLPRLATVLALLTAPFGAAQAQSFALQPNPASTGGINPFSIAVGDVDGDGDLDAVASNYATSTLGVLLNDGAGSFTLQANSPSTGTDGLPGGVAVADVDSDGDLDALITNFNTSTLGILLNNGAGSFTLQANSPSTGAFNGPLRVAVADVNGDAKPDALVTNRAANTLAVLLGNGAGGFALQTSPPSPPTGGSGAAPLSLAVVDLDADGDLDVLTTNGGEGTLGVLLGDGTGRFTRQANLPSIGPFSGPSDVAVADVNGDSKPDALVVAKNSDLVAVLLGDGTGGFVPGSEISTGMGSTPAGLAVADVSGDGRLDIIVANSNSNTLSVLLGDGAGSFALQADQLSVGAAAGPVGVALADVNGDGKLDILTVNNNTSTLGVLLNTAAATPTLSRIAPGAAVAGETLTLTGTNLTGANTVTFAGTANNTVAAVGFLSASVTEIRVVVPAGAETGSVTVTTAGGTSNGLLFTLIRDLTVTDGQEIYTSGAYRNVTVQAGGSLYLDGNLSVSGQLNVEPQGLLGTQDFVVSGAGSFRLQRRAEFFISNPAGISASGATGAIQVTGTRSYSRDAEYLYFGEEAQATGSGLPARVNVLMAGNGQVLTLTNPVGVRHFLSAFGGSTLSFPDGAITLLSDADSTANINYTGNSYPGVFTVQRHVSGDVFAPRAYRHLSSPVAGADVADLTIAGVFAPVVNPAYNTAEQARRTRAFPTVFGYDEQRLRPAANGGSLATDLVSDFDKGWFSPQTPADELTPGRGYTVHMPANSTLTFSGPVRTIDQTLTLTRQAGPAGAGWNLVGNPFAATFDMSDLRNVAGVDNAKYVLESDGPYSGTYRVYMPGEGEGPGIGSRFVALGQGFFTRVSEGFTTASLTLSRFAATFDQHDTKLRRGTTETRPLLALTLSNAAGTRRDETTLYQQAGATPGLDSRFDAVKLANPSGLNLSQQAAGRQLAINGLPAVGAATVVPLTVQVPAAGTYWLQVARLLNQPAGTTATLVDNVTGQRLNLATLPPAGYSFISTSAQTISGRFFLNLSGTGALAANPGLTAESISVSPNPARGRTTVLVPAVAGASQASFTLRDALGRTVLTRTAALPAAGLRQELNISGLTSGVYVLQVHVGGSNATRRVVVE